MLSEQRLLAAAQWHVRSQADDMDWDGFTRWLEADPANREAFDAIALDDDELCGMADMLASTPLPVPAPDGEAEPAANDDWPHTGHSRRWGRWAGGVGAVAAAAVAALILIPQVDQGSPPGETYIAANGPRQVTLDGGIQIALSKGARLSLASAGANEMTLHGVAFFDIPHRADRTITVHAGKFDVVDLGTSFEIASTPATVRVSVRDGAVSVRSARLSAPLRLTAGQGMASVGDGHTITRLNVAPAAVGSFRRGQLVYDDVPLSVVMSELGQYTDAEIAVEPDVAGRRFSGSLALANGADPVGTVAKLMDLRTSREGDVVRVASGGGDNAR